LGKILLILGIFLKMVWSKRKGVLLWLEVERWE